MYKQPTTFDWLVNSSSEETRNTARRTDDIAVLESALEAVKKKGEKTKEKIIQARINRLRKTGSNNQ
ncbi:MAG: hypothetical protein AB1553_01840 [Nitrospirota bacterium]